MYNDLSTQAVLARADGARGRRGSGRSASQCFPKNIRDISVKNPVVQNLQQEGILIREKTILGKTQNILKIIEFGAEADDLALTLFLATKHARTVWVCI